MQQPILPAHILPFYIFFIIRPDGIVAYNKFHEQYPLKIDTDKFIGLVSMFSAVNTTQTSIVHPDIVANRKEELDLMHRDSVKSFNTSTFQMRVLDTVPGYKFVLMADIRVDSKKIDENLGEIYRIYVHYVIKAPFMNKQQTIDSQQFKKKSNNILYR